MRLVEQPAYVERFIDGYIEAALWADCYPPDSDPDEEIGGREHLELRPGVRERMSVDCRAFIAANEADLLLYSTSRGVEADYAGHDFWLTRNGHGVGFWDRGLGELGDRLTAAADKFGEAYDHTPVDCGDGTADA